MLSKVFRIVSCVPIGILMLVNIAYLPSCSSNTTTATPDSVSVDSVATDSIVPPDTVKVLTDDEKIDSVRATLKGYKIVGVAENHGYKHLVYYKGQTVYAYSTHQPEIAEVEMPYHITDVAINSKTSNINVIVDSDPSQHVSMKVLYMVYFFETYNDDDDGVFCQLEWEEVGSAQAIAFVNKKTKIQFTTIVDKVFDGEGGIDYVTQDETSDLY